MKPELLLVCALVLFRGESRAADPFSSYDSSVERMLGEMLERASLPEAPAPVAPVPAIKPPPDVPKGALGRLRELRPELEGILREQGLPPELVAVVLVESGARLAVTSPRQARGLWQLIPATARRYGLLVDDSHDDRIYVARATRAAAHYLSDLYARFRNWPLALAAYNAGAQTVADAMEHARKSDFWSLSSQRLLPEETRRYVPAVLAAMKLLGASNGAALDESRQ